MFSLILILLCLTTIYAYWRETGSSLDKQNQLLKKIEYSREKYNKILAEYRIRVSEENERRHNILKLYEINHSLSHLLDIKEIHRVFISELKNTRMINEIRMIDKPSKNPKGFSCFALKGEKEDIYLSLKCSDENLLREFPYLLSHISLIIERASAYKKLEKLSITDSLTNLANRRHFTERYREEFNRSKKFGLNLSFSIVDIDHFKRYNDTYGHLAGDAVLRKLSFFLKENLREIDFLGRFGGEEFSAFLPETSKEQAVMVAERLRIKLEDTEFNIYDEKMKLTVSIGIAQFPVDSDKTEILIEKADTALYKAKKQGRNRVCIL